MCSVAGPCRPHGSECCPCENREAFSASRIPNAEPTPAIIRTGSNRCESRGFFERVACPRYDTFCDSRQKVCDIPAGLWSLAPQTTRDKCSGRATQNSAVVSALQAFLTVPRDGWSASRRLGWRKETGLVPGKVAQEFAGLLSLPAMPHPLLVFIHVPGHQ